ncbi:protein kinase [Actinosynnema sp. NPDC023587]|uniref:protein kinase domain-containing protein n=1 Tax=Actinosynnema sp. NPDC023587 TaxID=3154695 RepID=UPI0033DA0140
MNQNFGNRYALGPPLAGSALGEVRSGHLVEAGSDRPASPVSITLVDRRLATTPGVDAQIREQLAQVVGAENARLAVVREVVRDGDRLGLVTDPLPPATLRDLLDVEVRVLPAQVASLGADIASVLADLHGAYALHLAVCPENVRLDGSAVLLTGYGVEAARVTLRRTARDEITTAVPQYAAPEIAGDRAIGAGADVYSLGALLYEACCGRPPFTGSLTEVLRQHESMVPGVVPGMPRELADLIGRMLAKDPLHRPSAAEVTRQCGELALILGGLALVDGVPAPPRPVPLPSTGRFAIVPKRKKTRVLLGAGLVAMVGAGVLLFSGDGQPEAQPPSPPVPTTVATTTTTTTTTTTQSISSTTSGTTTSAPPTATGPVPVQLDSLKPVAGEWYGSQHMEGVSVNGTVFPHSLTSVLGDCGGEKGSVEYNLLRGYLSLEGTLGLSDDARVKETAVRVEVIVDDRPLFTDTVRFAHPVPVKVDLSGALRLTVQWQLDAPVKPCQAAELVFGDPRLTGVPGRMPTSGAPVPTTR